LFVFCKLQCLEVATHVPTWLNVGKLLVLNLIMLIADKLINDCAVSMQSTVYGVLIHRSLVLTGGVVFRLATANAFASDVNERR